LLRRRPKERGERRKSKQGRLKRRGRESLLFRRKRNKDVAMNSRSLPRVLQMASKSKSYLRMRDT
jgi:hypothetical protein